MSKIIDWHSHWIPERVLDLLSKRSDPPRVVRNSKGERVVLAQPWSKLEGSRSLIHYWHDIDLRLGQLDKAGVDQQLLSWPTTNQVDAFLPAEDARVIWAAYNEELSKVVEKHGDRFFGVAMVPTSDIAWAAGERSGPILDTIIRFALCEQWDVTLRQILEDAHATFSDQMLKD